MYDIIGDIHGFASQLEKLLSQMGYSAQQGVWKHPTRQVIFVGDFIDRGPEIRKVLQIVRDMVDGGNALAVMGNHEYNAIAYAHQKPDGTYLRPHSQNNINQHEKTLKEFSNRQAEWEDWLRWFYSLPLFLDLGELRVVHACWDQEHIDWLDQHFQGRLTENLLIQSHVKGSEAWTVIEETLKGKEINIPEHCAWRDKHGHLRTANRVKWWKDPTLATHEDLIFNCPDILKDQTWPADLKLEIYPEAAPPVFFGHYWLEDEWPVIQSHNVVCLDYSVANGGSLVAYRWSGEKVLDRDNFVTVK
jgi:hypothetical protein